MSLSALLLAMVAPTAIVDSAAGVPGMEPLQLLLPGTELVVGDHARVRLAYFASCVHETVRGGRLRIGVVASLTDDATVERVDADCTPPLAYASGGPGALVLRAGASTPSRREPTYRIRNRGPALVLAGGGALDLTALGLRLHAGALYRVCTRRGCVRLWVDPAANHDAGPVLERVVRIP
ncbi:MAG: hypothetical protein WD081_08745 [Gammaproteobacteria bacterium]